MAAMLFTILELGGVIVWTVYHLVEAGVKLLIPDKVIIIVVVVIIVVVIIVVIIVVWTVITPHIIITIRSPTRK